MGGAQVGRQYQIPSIFKKTFSKRLSSWSWSWEPGWLRSLPQKIRFSKLDHYLIGGSKSLKSQSRQELHLETINLSDFHKTLNLTAPCAPQCPPHVLSPLCSVWWRQNWSYVQNHVMGSFGWEACLYAFHFSAQKEFLQSEIKVWSPVYRHNSHNPALLPKWIDLELPFTVLWYDLQ